jgi:hypothetical protein
VVITGAVVYVLLRELRKSPPDSLRGTMAGLLYALMPIGAGVAQYMFYTIATGSSVHDGVVAKSLLYEPNFYPTEFVDAVFQNLTKLSLFVLTGLEPGNYLFPGTILFCVLGLWHLAFTDTRYRRFAVASGTALILAMSSTAILGLPGAPWGWHHYRYILPFFPPRARLRRGRVLLAWDPPKKRNLATRGARRFRPCVLAARPSRFGPRPQEGIRCRSRSSRSRLDTGEGSDGPFYRQTTQHTSRGMPLGLLPGMEYEEKEIALDAGEGVLFYTDGLVEAHDPKGEMFGFLGFVRSSPSMVRRERWGTSS